MEETVSLLQSWHVGQDVILRFCGVGMEARKLSPPRVSNSIATGHIIRVTRKSVVPKPAHQPPRHARCKSGYAKPQYSPDIQLSKRRMREWERCLWRNRAGTTERRPQMVKPLNRRLIYLWREYQDILPAHMVQRIQDMLGAQVPFRLDQAHANFIGTARKRKAKKKHKKCKHKRGLATLCMCDRRYQWVRKAMVCFAKGIQQRLCKSGEYTMVDRMKRLSCIVLQNMCDYIKTKRPSSKNNNLKAQFMIQIAEKVAVWIEEILLESDTRMLMMDYDEDDEVTGMYDGFTDEFLNMRETDGQRKARLEAEKLLGRPETPEERKRRQLIESRLGRPETPEELRARIEVEKKLGRPETEQELEKRIADQDLKKYGPETEAQKQARFESEKILGRPETEAERKKRQEIEKQLGRPETPEELRARLAAEKSLSSTEESDGQRMARLEAEKLLGRPETAEELSRRLEMEKRLGRPETPEEVRARTEAEKKLGRPETEAEIKTRIAAQDLKKYGPETEVQKQARLQSEKLLGRPETEAERKTRQEIEKQLGRPETPKELRTRLEAEKILGRPETSEERSRRLDIEKRMGRPETPEELRARTEAEKRLGRPETEEEFKKRIADQDLKKYGPETEAQKQARAESEKILGRPETEAERKKRQEIEKQLGRPETPDELRARLAAEKSLESTEETDGQRMARLEAEKLLGRPETADERSRRLEMEKRLGRPETPEEVRARTEAEKKLGRPETEAEIKKRIAAQDLKKYGNETEVQKQARLESEKILGRPETEAERKTRQEAEKQLGRPERPEELRARLEAEKILGRPETTEERSRRLEIQKRMGRPETPEELRARTEAEKRLGRPETEEEFKKRIADQDRQKYGPETDAQKRARLQTENILGRPETEAERKKRQEIEKRLGRPETPQELRSRMEAEKKLGRPETEEEFNKRMKKVGTTGEYQEDPEREAATKALRKELKAKGGADFHESSKVKLTHSEASDWLTKAPVRVDKFVMESGETDKVTQKFEKKLGALMANTPAPMQDVMQDVIIESSRNLAEYFVAKNYRSLVSEALIAELQKRGSTILIEVDGVVETTFQAAQRLKLAKSLQVSEPNDKLSHNLAQNLNEVVKRFTMSRKFLGTMREYIDKEVADYLSVHVAKPEPRIEAYIALLHKMEAAGDRLLIEGDITKSFKDAASYLRQLTTFEDKINRSNSGMQSKIEKKLKDVMSNVKPRGYSDSDMSKVITDNAKLLTSYIMLQREKTEALKALITEMDKKEDNVLLRHGSVRKTYTDGADILRGKNTEQLITTGADVVAARKIKIKLKQIMSGNTPNKFKSLMHDVIEDAVTHLAVALLQPHSIKVCKCMNNVYVQCELWYEEMLRRVAAHPPCKCSRIDESVQMRSLLASLVSPSVASPDALQVEPDRLHATISGDIVEVTQCPVMRRTSRRSASCPSWRPDNQPPHCCSLPSHLTRSVSN